MNEPPFTDSEQSLNAPLPRRGGAGGGAGILIVGSGIAGLTLSVLLARHGIAHRVLARHPPPPAFALAETLPPTALPLLARLGLLDTFEAAALHHTHGYHSSWGSTAVADHNFFAYRPYQYGLKLDKAALVAALAQRQAAHLLPCEGSFRLRREAGGLVLETTQHGQPLTLRPRFVVDATGRRRAVLRQLGIGTSDEEPLTAFSCHLPRVAHPALRHAVFVESFASGWGIVSGLSETQNVLTLYSRPTPGQPPALARYAHWPAALADTAYLRHFLTAPTPPRLRGQAAGSARAAALAGPDWLALGDAALSFDPLASHGITNAVYTAWRGAEAVAQLLHHGDASGLRAYEAGLRAVFGQYRQARAGLYAGEQRWAGEAFWAGVMGL